MFTRGANMNNTRQVIRQSQRRRYQPMSRNKIAGGEPCVNLSKMLGGVYERVKLGDIAPRPLKNVTPQSGF